MSKIELYIGDKCVGTAYSDKLIEFNPNEPNEIGSIVNKYHYDMLDNIIEAIRKEHNK